MQKILFTLVVVAYFTVINQAPADTNQLHIDVKSLGAVGDGKNDDTQNIQKALDMADKASGLVVFFPPGKYKCGVLDIKSNTTIKGEAATLFYLDNLNKNWINAHNRQNIFIYNMTFDGNKLKNDEASKVIGHNYTIVADTFTAYQCQNLVISFCNFINAPDSAIMLSSCRDSKILNNYLDGGNDLGIYVSNDYSLKGDKDKNALADCIISSNNILNFPYGGIGLKRVSRRVVVSNNAIHHCGNGITLENASTEYDFSKDILITGNQIRYIGNYPDQIWYPTKEAPAGYGINLRCSDFSLVTNNKLEDCFVNSILVEGSKYCNISNNVINASTGVSGSDSQTGIFLKEREYAMRAYTEKAESAARITAITQYCTISGNIVVGQKEYGILEAKNSLNNIFMGNICRENKMNFEIQKNDSTSSENLK